MTAVRLAAFYAAVFGFVGIHLPFFPLWLGSRGLDPTEIGVLLATVSLVRVFTTPWIGAMADRLGERRRPMIVLAVLCTLFYAACAWAEGFWMLLAFGVLAGIAHAGLTPLGDTTAMGVVTARGLDYGRLRLWGSLAFIGASAAGGWLLKGRDPDLVIAMLTCGAAAILLSCILIPVPQLTKTAPRSRSVRRLLNNRTFVLFLVTCGAVQASHAVYYALATVDWKTSGLDETSIGLLSAEAVVAEVFLFAVSGRAVAHLGPIGLLGASGVAGVLRWSLMAASPSLPALAAAQILHAFTFGAAHLAAMHFLQRASPDGQAAAAQSTYSAVGMGLSMGLALLASGPLYTAFGAGAYAAMAVLSAAGLLGAAILARMWDGARLT